MLKTGKEFETPPKNVETQNKLWNLVKGSAAPLNNLECNEYLLLVFTKGRVKKVVKKKEQTIKISKKGNREDEDIWRNP